MFNEIITNPSDALLKDRLSRIVDRIRQLKLSTREDYGVAVYSAVNSILAIGNQMTPLVPVAPESPAVVGDVVDNFQILNQDAVDIASEIARVEDSAASLYNLAAASQNHLRQQIREGILSSSLKRYVEPFLNDKQTNKSLTTSSVDFQSGRATLPLLAEKTVVPSISIGTSSVGSLLSGLDILSTPAVGQSMIWNGSVVELILSFAQPTIVNRLKIEPDDYAGLEITTLTSSPDGTVFEDVLDDLGLRAVEINATSGKYSGTVIMDFAPRFVKQMRVVIEDRVGDDQIALRSLSMLQRSFSSSGVVTSLPIPSPAGSVTFSAIVQTEDPLTSVVHQVSADGVQFQNVAPGPITLGANSVYRAVLARAEREFSDSQSPLLITSVDPEATSGYTIVTTSSIPLGDGVIERTLVLQNVTGPVTLRETPMQGTLRVQSGSIFLGSDQYAFASKVLSLTDPASLITVSYQASAFDLNSLAQLKDYYTPVLEEVRFTV